jgi:hypothetical protein
VIKFLTSGIAIAGVLGVLHVVGTQADVLAGASHAKGDRLDSRPIEAACGDWPYYHHVCLRDLTNTSRARRKAPSYRGPITGGRHFSLSYEDSRNSEARRGLNGSIGSTDHLGLVGSPVRHAFGGRRSRWRLSHGIIICSGSRNPEATISVCDG